MLIRQSRVLAVAVVLGVIVQTSHSAEPVKELAPSDYLAHLKKEVTKRSAYTLGFDGPVPAAVKEGDVSALIKLIDSKEPCSATIKAGLARLPSGSTVGQEAGVLLDSYRLDKTYPIAESSADHVVDPKVIKAWYNERKRGFDIRLSDGSVAIPYDAIVTYDWDTHTLTLKRGMGERLRKAIHRRREQLIVPFIACLGGKPIYHGQFVSPESSQSSEKVTIVFDLDPRTLDQLRISRGYAVDETRLVDTDPRGDERIKRSLETAGKLK